MFAIQIASTGVYLDLKGASIRWETVNEVFSENSFQGDWSFPFDIQFTTTNLKALGFVNKPAIASKSLRIPVILYFGNNSYSAMLIINGSKAAFNCNIAGGLKGLVNADKKLSELSFADIQTGNDYLDLGVSFGNLSSYQYVNWKKAAAFPPYYNPNFYGSVNPTFNGVVNRMDATTGAYMQNDVGIGNKYCISPWLYLFFILKTIFDENGLSMDGSFIADSEASSLLVYSNYALDKKRELGCLVKTASNQALNFGYSNTGGDNVQLVDTEADCYDPDDNWANTTYQYETPDAGSYACRFSCRVWGWNSVTNSLGAGYIAIGISINGTVFNTEEVYVGVNEYKDIVVSYDASGLSASDIIEVNVNNGAPDAEPDGNFDNICELTLLKGASLQVVRYDAADFNEMDTIMYFKNHVPDITVSEFIRLVKNFARLKTDFDWQNKVAKLDYIKSVIDSGPVVDLTPLTSPYMEQVFDESNKGFTLQYNFGSDELVDTNVVSYDESKIIGEFNAIEDAIDPAIIGDLIVILNTNKVYEAQLVGGVMTWVFKSEYYSQIQYGNGEKSYELQLSPIFMTLDQENESATSDPDHIKCLMPTILETGSSPMFELGTNPPSLRIAFMRGRNIDYTGIGGRYIYASPTNVDINGNSVGDYNLRLSGTDYNWYKEKHQSFLESIDSGEFYEVLVRLPLSYLKYKTKIQINNINYLVKNISTGITQNTVKESLMKLMKL